jgi:hypothetical protein
LQRVGLKPIWNIRVELSYSCYLISSRIDISPESRVWELDNRHLKFPGMV